MKCEKKKKQVAAVEGGEEEEEHCRKDPLDEESLPIAFHLLFLFFFASHLRKSTSICGQRLRICIPISNFKSQISDPPFRASA